MTLPPVPNNVIAAGLLVVGCVCGTYLTSRGLIDPHVATNFITAVLSVGATLLAPGVAATTKGPTTP